MTSSNINLPEFSEDDFYDFSKDTILIGKLFKKSNRELCFYNYLNHMF